MLETTLRLRVVPSNTTPALLWKVSTEAVAAATAAAAMLYKLGTLVAAFAATTAGHRRKSAAAQPQRRLALPHPAPPLQPLQKRSSPQVKFGLVKVPYLGIMKTETEADDKKLHHLLCKIGMDDDGALTAVQEIRTMAGQNILAKMDTQYAKIDSKLQSINRIIGFFGVGIGIFLAALNIYERRSQNRPQSGDAKPFTGGAKLDRPGGPRSIPEVFCGTPEGCIKWSYTLKYGAV